MLLSMTGYGRATQTHGDKTFTVEIRSLNSKQNDLRLRSAVQLHRYEMDLRRQILDHVKRGKLEVTIEVADEAPPEGPVDGSIWARLGGFAFRNRRGVLGAWVTVLVAVIVSVGFIGASSD